MNFVEPLIFFGLFSVLFFIVSLQTGSKLRTVGANIIFLVLVYCAIANLLGNPKPVTNIPLYKHDLGVTSYLMSGFWDTNTIILEIKEDDKYRLYQFPRNEKFIDALKRWKASNEPEDTELHWDSLDETVPSIRLPDPETDHSAPKPVPHVEERHYDVN